MDVTVRDLQNMSSLKGMKLIAGDSGLDNVVSKGGFLDYEYDRGHKEKYFHRNFLPGQFILTSFLYTKDNEHNIADAVKRLHLRGCSGLAVKNIYKLQIRDNVLRYADANRFPVFIIVNKELYFEDIIFEIADRVAKTSSVHYGADIVNQILHAGLDGENVERLSRTLNPSFCDETVAAYLRFEKSFSPADFLALTAKEKVAALLAPEDAVLYYKNGFLLVHSYESGRRTDGVLELEQRLGAVMAATRAKVRVGVSDRHHNLFEMKEALTECVHAALAPVESGRPWRRYADLGVFALCFRAARDPAALAFANGIVGAIRAYDTENNASLFRTARIFVLADGDIKAAAGALGLHGNTVRYRLETISAITRRNILNKGGYEEFSMALKIAVCREALDSLD